MSDVRFVVDIIDWSRNLKGADSIVGGRHWSRNRVQTPSARSRRPSVVPQSRCRGGKGLGLGLCLSRYFGRQICLAVSKGSRQETKNCHGGPHSSDRSDPMLFLRFSRFSLKPKKSRASGMQSAT
jgi:hypothetical protein